MNRCFITGIGCISPQNTAENGFLEEPEFYATENILYVQKPDYKNYIPIALLRRMGAGVKNGLVAACLAMDVAGAAMPDAIITGTGLGCMRDSEKFLRSMLDEGEEFLTPTSFIQSTHNTVAGQIALSLDCKAYNMNYVNAAASFPSALLDSLMLIQDGEAKGVLTGGVDELADFTTKLYELVDHIGQTDSVYNKSKAGEGAAFFYLEANLRDQAYCEVMDVAMQNSLEVNEVGDFICNFLEKNDLMREEIDVIISGENGDIKFDNYYSPLENEFGDSSILIFKQIFGEFLTSPAIAMWLACKIFKDHKIPEVLMKYGISNPGKIRNILIYNQYRAKDHCLILLRNVDL